MFFTVIYQAKRKGFRGDAVYVNETSVLKTPHLTDVSIHGHRTDEHHARNTTLAVKDSLVLPNPVKKTRVIIIPEPDAIYGVTVLRFDKGLGYYEAHVLDVLNKDIIALKADDFFCIAGTTDTVSEALDTAERAIPGVVMTMLNNWRDFKLPRAPMLSELSPQLRPLVPT